MIICSCARISSSDVQRAIHWMRASDPRAVVTPGKVYRALGKRPDCGGCMRLFVNNMRPQLQAASPIDPPIELQNLRTGRKVSHEKR
ncbi:MAG: (2Fe-2S)-binding protein [Pikeienuella sp.]